MQVAKTYNDPLTRRQLRGTAWRTPLAAARRRTDLPDPSISVRTGRPLAVLKTWTCAELGDSHYYTCTGTDLAIRALLGRRG